MSRADELMGLIERYAMCVTTINNIDESVYKIKYQHYKSLADFLKKQIQSYIKSGGVLNAVKGTELCKPVVKTKVRSNL